MSTRYDPLPAHLHEITRLIAGVESEGSFATSFTEPADSLELQVDGVGVVWLPVDAATIRRLRKVAQPAHYGLKDQTLLDPTVRDTWEIPGDRLSVDPKRWQPALAQALERIRRNLGLSIESRIEARLHNLLIYGPGQFFKPHQDSEKADGMIGSLVIALPSRFTGGEFLITHHDETLRIGGSSSALTFIAFYTDCRHEVRPIETGHRVVLTWNLIVDNPAPQDPAATPLEALSRRIRAYFDAPKASRWGWDSDADSDSDAAGEPPDRLVYLLDHEYSQRGLHWNQLKNSDALRAAMLLEVAGQLDCEIYLALADIHETWTCEDDYYDGRYREGGFARARHSNTYELVELIESEIELRHWLAPDSAEGEAVSVVIDDRELCYSKPSVDCEPFASEHEGYTGNAGNTVDHWYHRAAIVLWPRERNFVIRAKASATWAVSEITRTLACDGREAALARTRRVLPFWRDAIRGCPQPDRPDLVIATLQLAVGLDEAELAPALLPMFRLSDLTPEVAPHFAKLVERRGLDEGRSVLLAWMAESHPLLPVGAVLAWLSSGLLALCRALCAGSVPLGQEAMAGAVLPGELLAHELLVNRWAWLQRHIDALRQAADNATMEASLSGLGMPLLGLIESCGLAGQPVLRDRIVAALIERHDSVALHLPLAVLRAAEAHGDWPAMGLAPLRQHLLRELSGRLARTERRDDDWSIDTPIQGADELSETLTRFLRSPEQRRLEWPLAEARRRRVHDLIRRHGLPVQHTTRRSGSPYTLVLEKTRAIFERDAAARRGWAEALA